MITITNEGAVIKLNSLLYNMFCVDQTVIAFKDFAEFKWDEQNVFKEIVINMKIKEGLDKEKTAREFCNHILAAMKERELV